MQVARRSFWEQWERLVAYFQNQHQRSDDNEVVEFDRMEAEARGRVWYYGLATKRGITLYLRRWNLKRCGVLLFCILAFIWLIAYFEVFQSGVLRPSSDVKSSGFHGYISGYHKQLEYYMDYTRSCGVTLSHVRVYYKYLLLDSKSLPHGDRDLFNPSYREHPVRSGNATSYESSNMCSDPKSIEVIRHSSIIASYETIHGKVETVLDGPVAYCFQHNVDIMNGVWPCRRTEANLAQYRVPKLPFFKEEL